MIALLVLFNSLLFAGSPSLAAGPIPFFRSALSPFPSGQASLSELNKSKTRTESKFALQVKRNKQELWLSPDTVARDINLSNIVYSPQKNQKYRVLKIQGAWILGERGDRKQEWLNLYHLVPDKQDLGRALTLLPLRLREQPSWKSPGSITLPAGTSLQFVETMDEDNGQWAKVRFDSVGSQVGYVQLSQVLLKHDFASFALVKNKWRAVQYRSLNKLLLDHNEQIHLSEALAIITRPELAIAIKADPTREIKIRNQFFIEKISAELWNISRLKDHGEVYWKIAETSPGISTTITLDHLFARKIHNVAIDSKNSNVSLVSAGGIFFSDNGKTWKKLSQFGDEDQPVAISPRGELFVGHMRSRDQGKTFQPYLAWENIIKQVVKSGVPTPSSLKLSTVEFPSDDQVKLKLELGQKTITLLAKLNRDVIRSWSTVAR